MCRCIVLQFLCWVVGLCWGVEQGVDGHAPWVGRGFHGDCSLILKEQLSYSRVEMRDRQSRPESR
jgi:hypothetical protein